MFRRNAVFVALLLTSILLVGCGPSETAHDEEQAQQNATNAEQKAENDLVAGKYKGTMTVKDGSIQAIEITIISSETVQTVNGGNTEVPTLTGYTFFYDANIQPGGGQVMATYNTGTYNEAVGRLQMSSAMAGLAGTVFELDLAVDGPHLTGIYLAPSWETDDVDVYKEP